MIRGCDVLERLVELTSRPATPGLEPAVGPARLARELGTRDGRATAGHLQRLMKAGLAERGKATRRLKEYRGAQSTVYSPTKRGREVDALLAKGTAARGGTFTPFRDLGISTTEWLALR